MMRKIKWFMDYSKEEQWLSDMWNQGYRLVKKMGWHYYFSTESKENRMVRMDYQTFKRKEDFQDYILLFADSGWKHIVGTKDSGKQYFVQMNDKSNDIFSDASSKADCYKRMMQTFLLLGITFSSLLFIYKDTLDIQALTNPKVFYYTPGLWNLTSWEFIGRFLFETPFAIMRGYGTLIILLFVMMQLMLAVRAWWLYQKTKERNN